jgi:hypothetical protein
VHGGLSPKSGITLEALAKNRDKDLLRRAVQAHEAALEERTRERAPLDWAQTQNNLGNALLVLGERGDDAALGRAVQAVEAALGEYRRLGAPAYAEVAEHELQRTRGLLGAFGVGRRQRQAAGDEGGEVAAPMGDPDGAEAQGRKLGPAEGGEVMPQS